MRYFLLAAIFLAGFSLTAEVSSLDYLNGILNQNSSATNRDFNRLSQGTMLLTDDPASRAIYDRLSVYVQGLDRLVSNLDDMESFYNVEDAALGNLTDIYRQIRDLILQRSSGLLGPSDLDIINSQISQMADEAIDILNQTQFNTKPIFGSLLSDPLIVNAIREPKHYTLAGVDALMALIEQQRADEGARVDALKYQRQGDQVAAENHQQMQSHGDTDYSNETLRLRRNQILLMADILMLKRK